MNQIQEECISICINSVSGHTGDEEAGVVEHALQGARAVGSRVPAAAWLPPILAAFDRSGGAHPLLRGIGV